MLRGFNPWQKRTALVGTLGAIIAFLGILGPWLPVIVGGIVVSLCCILILTLLGNRQNWRLLRSIQRDLPQGQHQQIQQKPAFTQKTKGVPSVGVNYEYANRIKSNRSALESFALRSQSLDIRDAFALAATGNQLHFQELVRFISVQRMRMLPDLKRNDLRHWDSNALLSLARLQANQRATEVDLENAVKFFSFIHAFFGTKSLKKNDRLIFLEVLGELNRYEQQAALIRRFDVDRRFPVQTSLLKLNSIRSNHGSNSKEWLDNLNALYISEGFSPVRMSDSTSRKPLDRLSTNVASYSDGPRVSVIVPTFQGGELLLSSLNSLVNQSWSNLEVIVVDDGSGPAYESYLKRAENLSPKIKVLRQERNLGAYCARNAGLAVATGEYITVHDDDDWSHGDKIATQVRQLIDNPDIPANMSGHVRVTDDLKFTRINNNPVLSQANFSSLMTHRSVFEKIGPWDTVNRGADSEFRDRIVKYFDQPVAVINDVPLSFTRTWEGSLTSGEMRRGFVDPSRLLYLNAYTQAHSSGQANTSEFTSSTRGYPVPSTMEAGARHKHLGNFDLVFMTDFRFPGGTTSLTITEIEVAFSQGLRVGFIHTESPLNGPNTPISSKLFALQLEGKVEQIGLQDSANIDLLVIRHPSVTTYMDQTTTKLTVDQTVLLVNNPPVLQGGTGMVFDLVTSMTNLDRMFGVRTEVVAESGVTRTLCEGLVPGERLLDETWPGLISTDVYETSNSPDFQRSPVVGRHSRDHPLKWPSDKDEFDAAYRSEHFQTRILGGAKELEKKHGAKILEGVTVYEFGELDVREFLNGIDFWVYFHDDKLVESFGMSIAEAMAAGKIAILPPYLRSTFGEGAVYAKPTEVESIVGEFWRNPEEFKQQAQRARRYVEENFSKAAFLERVGRLKKNNS